MFSDIDKKLARLPQLYGTARGEVDFFGYKLGPGFYGITGKKNTGKTYLCKHLSNQGSKYVGIDEPDEDRWAADDHQFMDYIINELITDKSMVINSFKARMYIPNPSDQEGLGSVGVRNNLFLICTVLSIEFRLKGYCVFGVFPAPPSHEETFSEKLEFACSGLIYLPFKKTVLLRARGVNNRETVDITY